MSGNQALLLSDIALDTMPYNVAIDNKWENSAIRKWINGYEMTSDELSKFKTKNFIGSAFSETEKLAIVKSDVENVPNSEYLISAGGDTQDQIFLLSESETSGDSARDYGFGIPTSESAATRLSKSSTYAKAMGIQFKATDATKGFSAWWLRTPGWDTYSVTRCMDTGNVSSDTSRAHVMTGVRSALNLNLSSGSGVCYAGKVCSDGTVEEIPVEDNEAIDNLGNPKTQYASGKIGTRLKAPTIKEF